MTGQRVSAKQRLIIKQYLYHYHLKLTETEELSILLYYGGDLRDRFSLD